MALPRIGDCVEASQIAHQYAALMSLNGIGALSNGRDIAICV